MLAVCTKVVGANGFRSERVSVVSRLIGHRPTNALDWFVPAREQLPPELIYTVPAPVQTRDATDDTR